MSITSNLELNKHDNPSSNTNPFDIENYLNANWDKIDQFAGNINSEITDINDDINAINTSKADRNELPTKVSDLTNDTGFITNAVNNLVNYYLKSDTYTRTEVNTLISNITKVTIQVVAELPQVGESNVIYLVPSSNPKTKNIKDEYIYVNNNWEQIGSTEIDLTGYATENWVNAQISDFLTEAQIETLVANALADYYDKDEIDELVTELEAENAELQQENKNLRKAGYKLNGTGENVTLNKTSDNRFVKLDIKGNKKQDTSKYIYICDGTETGDYYFVYNSANYQFTMPTIQSGDILVFDSTTLKLYLDSTEITTTIASTGTLITLTNTPNPNYECPVKAVGDDVNLFDKDNANTLDCLINGNTNVIASYNGAKTLYIPITGGETYTVSKKTSARFIVSSCINVPANNVECSNVIQGNNLSSITIGSNTADKYLCIFYYLNGTDTLTEQQILDSIKIQKGTEATPWSPYGMGNVNTTIIKNWLHCNTTSQIINGITVTKNNDGSVTLNGTATAGTNIYFSMPATSFTIPAGTYKWSLKGRVKDKNDMQWIATNTSYSTGINRNSAADYKEVTYPEDVTITHVYTYFTSGTTFDNVTLYPRLEYLGDNPKYKSQVYNIPCQKPMLDESDYFDWDNEQEVHGWKKVVLDGIENYALQSINEHNIANYRLIVGNNTMQANTIISNNFIHQNASISQVQTSGIFNNVNEIYIRIDSNIASTVEQFKAYLAEQYANGTPVYVWYKLAEPELLPFTAEQKAVAKEIDKATSYYEQTNIFSINEVSPIYDTTAVADMNLVVDELSQAIVANGGV